MKKFLKIAAIIVGVLVLLGAVGYSVVMYASSGARSTARDFIMLSSTGNHDEANAFLHQSLRTEENIQKIAAIFDGVDPYTEVSFSGVSMSGGSTSLEGTAKTGEGCASKVEMQMVEEQITYFNISPLCR
ncbi:hypothetical protein [Marivita geojedonensis]|uniref:Uncharacterized protein n=1 Tax=Marivita geojedonensis TaxID=1123756 RepID=A0A1X4NID1_9RHOB|nr:hypothetical protein [Marivita geojedonensis]OSQ48218.1 hypothetical protein MGEO_14975 [Marivita geojedonensis]PRY74912.1 hypothetical protein CLV76_11751 [Marivita geojedonensis]